MLLIIGLLVYARVELDAAGDNVTVQGKAGTVIQDEQADSDAQKTTADSVETIGEEGAKIKITSKNLKPPSGWLFRQFKDEEKQIGQPPQVINPGAGYPSPWVDFHKGPPTPETPEVLQADANNIKFRAIFPTPTTAGTWPLRAEGNMTPTGSRSGGQIAERYWRVEVQACSRLIIVDTNMYVVPGSQLNAVRYKFPQNAPTSARLEVYDASDSLVRTISDIPTSYVTDQDYAEIRWNGHKDTSGTDPLTEASGPYRLRVVGVWSSEEHYCDRYGVLVEEWLMPIVIDDAPVANEHLVTGVDAGSITSDTLSVKIGIDDSNLQATTFTVEARTEAKDGPSGNDWGAHVIPSRIFYTTPTSPYDIKYKVVIEQTTDVISVTGGGLEVVTVKDGVGNLWDMNPNAAGRQIKGTWTFGIDSNGEPATEATQRDLVETYE